jgi:hypothetical protein
MFGFLLCSSRRQIVGQFAIRAFLARFNVVTFGPCCGDPVISVHPAKMKHRVRVENRAAFGAAIGALFPIEDWFSWK